MSAERWDDSGGFSRDYPVVVSYFTDDLYANQAFQLARSCQLVGLAYSIERVPDLGSWSRNTSHKPEFLQRKAKENPEQAILWLDADARVWKRPVWFNDRMATIAYHRRLGREALSGTVYLSDWCRMRDVILQGWVEECRKHPDLPDQACMERSLGTIVRDGRHPEVWQELPESYCRIFDGVFQLEAPSSEPPVIEHFQVSRWSRKRVGAA